jgi:hypothetical protein
VLGGGGGIRATEVSLTTARFFVTCAWMEVTETNVRSVAAI